MLIRQYRRSLIYDRRCEGYKTSDEVTELGPVEWLVRTPMQILKEIACSCSMQKYQDI